MAPNSDKERIRYLELRTAYLEEEKKAAESALESAAALGYFPAGHSPDHLQEIVRQTVSKAGNLFRFKAAAVHLVDQSDGDMVLAYCDKEQYRGLVERETEALINDAVFAWVLGRNKPVLLTGADGSEQLLLHAIGNGSGVYGMFLGFLDQDRKSILDMHHKLLTLVMLACATALEGHALYSRIGAMNRELQETVERLAASEKELLGHRRRLEEEVSERTRDLRQSNERLSREVMVRGRIQAELHQERDFIAKVLDTTGALILILDDKGRVVRVNRAFEVVSGYPADDLQDAVVWEHYAFRRDGEELHNLFQSMLRDGHPSAYEHHVYCRQGGRRRVVWESSALRDPSGKVEFVIVSGIDVTGAVSAEKALQDSEARFKAMFQRASIGITLRNIHGEFLDCNPVFCRMLDYTRNDFMYKRAEDVTHPEDVEQSRREFEKLIHGEIDKYSLEKRYLRRDGSVVWGRVVVTPVHRPGSEPYYISMVEDITDRKA